MIRTEIADNVYLNYIPHTRFKANYLTMNFLTPLERETAALYSLVPRVLSQGCAAYPGTVALAEQLQSLYNLSLSRNRVFKRGETQVICQSAWFCVKGVSLRSTGRFLSPGGSFFLQVAGSEVRLNVLKLRDTVRCRLRRSGCSYCFR